MFKVELLHWLVAARYVIIAGFPDLPSFMKQFAIDAFDFGLARERCDGALPVTAMPRLVPECVDASGTMLWSLTGGTHASGHPQLALTVSGAVQLVCQRCMQPFEYWIDANSVLVLARDDVQADQIEEMLDDDSLDVIVGSAALNVMDLIEDETLLALPQAPKHVECPSNVLSAISSAGDALGAAKSSPFAVLKNLKH